MAVDGGLIPCARFPIPDAYPDASVLLDAATNETKLRDRPDQRLLHLPQIPVEILSVALEIDDRVADQLTRPMEGDVAAALDLEQLDPVGREVRRRGDEIRAFRRSPER